MPKKTTILILILAVITGLLVFLAIRETQPKPPPTPVVQKVVPTKAVAKTAILSFSPTTLDLSTISTPTPVDILMDTGGAQVTGVQLEITFDPKAVTNLKISPSDNSIFGAKTDNIVLINDVNLSTGRVSFAVAAAVPGKTVKGIGKIATLTIQKAFGTDITATQIVFLDKTMVVMPGTNDSILKSSIPLTVQLLPGKTPSPSIQQLVPVVSPTVTR